MIFINKNINKGVDFMPIICINLLEGRTKEQKVRLVKEVTEAVSRTIDVPTDKVSILLNERTKDLAANNGILFSEMDK